MDIVTLAANNLSRFMAGHYSENKKGRENLSCLFYFKMDT
jgi:hypothetical protein